VIPAPICPTENLRFFKAIILLAVEGTPSQRRSCRGTCGSGPRPSEPFVHLRLRRHVIAQRWRAALAPALRNWSVEVIPQWAFQDGAHANDDRTIAPGLLRSCLP